MKAALLVLAGWLLIVRPAAADEGGVSFWLPGQLGSFAAVPGEPGWSLPIIYYHASSDAEASGSAFQIGGRTCAGSRAKADLFLRAELRLRSPWPADRPRSGSRDSSAA